MVLVGSGVSGADSIDQMVESMVFFGAEYRMCLFKATGSYLSVVVIQIDLPLCRCINSS